MRINPAPRHTLQKGSKQFHGHQILYFQFINYLQKVVYCYLESRHLVSQCSTLGGHKLDHLAIKSTTAVAGKAGFTLASFAMVVVEFIASVVVLW